MKAVKMYAPGLVLAFWTLLAATFEWSQVLTAAALLSLGAALVFAMASPRGSVWWRRR